EPPLGENERIRPGGPLEGPAEGSDRRHLLAALGKSLDRSIRQPGAEGGIGIDAGAVEFEPGFGDQLAVFDLGRLHLVLELPANPPSLWVDSLCEEDHRIL